MLWPEMDATFLGNGGGNLPTVRDAGALAVALAIANRAACCQPRKNDRLILYIGTRTNERDAGMQSTRVLRGGLRSASGRPTSLRLSRAPYSGLDVPFQPEDQDGYHGSA